MRNRPLFLGALWASPYVAMVLGLLFTVILVGTDGNADAGGMLLIVATMLAYAARTFGFIGVALSEEHLKPGFKLFWILGFLMVPDLVTLMYLLFNSNGIQPGTVQGVTADVVAPARAEPDNPFLLTEQDPDHLPEPDAEVAVPVREVPRAEAVATPKPLGGTQSAKPARPASPARGAVVASDALDRLSNALATSGGLPNDASRDIHRLIGELRNELRQLEQGLVQLEDARQRLDARGQLLADLTAEEMADELADDAAEMLARHQETLAQLKRRRQSIHLAFVQIAQTAQEVELGLRDGTIGAERAGSLRQDLERTSRAAQATIAQVQRRQI
jgi:hypothetical protein